MTDSLQNNLQSLPEDAEALRALILVTFAERDMLLAQNDRSVAKATTPSVTQFSQTLSVSTACARAL